MNRESGKKILFEAKEVLDKYNVEFWLMHGTCLGAYRDKQIIENDKDMDLGVRAEILLPKIDLLIEEFKQRDYKLELCSAPYPKVRTIFIWKYGCLLEIMGWFKAGDIRFALTQTKYNAAYPHQARFFDNLQDIEFLGAKWKIPNYVEEFLEESYGKDWKTPIDNKYDEKETVGYWELVKDKIEI